MPSTLESNLAFEKSMMPQVKALLKKHAAHIIRIDTATEEEDTRQATDLVLRVDSGTIAVRIRRLETMVKVKDKRDLTIRTRAHGGGRTEFDKIRDGWGDWYFYAWSQKNQIAEYMLLDIQRIRSSGLLDALQNRQAIPNVGDNTEFKAISIDELLTNDCVVVHTVENCPGKLHVASKAVVVSQLNSIQSAVNRIMQQVDPVSSN